MKSRLHLFNLILALTLAIMPAAAAYSQNTGTSPQSGTSSQSQNGVQSQSEAPGPNVGESQVAPPQTGTGNAQNVASRSVGWGWLILGFVIGLVVGALAWRRSAAVEGRDRTTRRVA